MSFRKKVAVTTLAASIAAGAFAGLPLSSKGLAEKIGFSVAAAAEFPNQTYQDKLAAIKGALTTTQLSQVYAAHDLVRTRFGAATSDNVDLIQPALDKINAKLTTDLTGTEEADLYALFGALMIIHYDVDGTHLEDLRTRTDGPQWRPVVERLAMEAENDGNSTINNDLTVADIVDFLVKAETAAYNQIAGSTIDQLLDLYTNPSARDAKVQAAYDALLTQSNQVVDILKYYNIDSATFKAVAKNFEDALTDPADKTTLKNGAIALASAFIKINTSTPNPGPGPIVVVPPGGNNPGQVVSDVKSQIGQLASQIANATGTERAALILQAVNAAQTAIEKVTTISVSSKVIVSNGTATVSLTASDVSAAISALKEIIDALKAAAPGAEQQLTPPVLTLDVGTVNAGKTTANLSADLMAQAQGAGIGGVKLQSGDFASTLPVGGQFTGNVEFSVDTTGTAPTGAKTVSKVFSFDAKINNAGVTQFEKPILLEFFIPQSQLENVDTELLTLMRIIDGRLENVGGKYRNGKFAEKRNSFSSYVVVENKVSFNDTASVQSWAGRQIDVVAAKGVVQGRAVGQFVPKGIVTRAEFAKMLVSALELEDIAATENFADVNESDWFAPYVAAAVKAGVINGRTATTFAPKATITRAEMATMISRALKLEAVTDVDAALKAFSDAGSINATLKAGVASASAEGLIIGNQGKFNPNATATRAEAAVIIYRAMNK